MKAFVLAAGRGERLKPLTLKTPKPLLEVGGAPALHRTLRMLARDGFTDVVINLHHLGEQIRESAGDGSNFGLSINYSPEKTILGAAGGIKAAQKLIGEETFLAINADVLIDIDLKELWEFHAERGGAATLALRDDPEKSGYGAVKVDSQGLVRDILGQPGDATSADWKPRLFTGVQVLEPVFFKYAPHGKWSSTTQDVFPAMLRDGLKIHAYEHNGYFFDIGTPERLEAARKNCPKIR